MDTENLKVKKLTFETFGEKNKFLEEEGYKMSLNLLVLMDEYANQVNAVARVIEILEEWKKRDFYTTETTYNINWFGCFKYDESIEKVTLTQAKRLYKEIKIKYDTLYEIFKEVGEIHYDDENHLIDKYFK